MTLYTLKTPDVFLLCQKDVEAGRHQVKKWLKKAEVLDEKVLLGLLFVSHALTLMNIADLPSRQWDVCEEDVAEFATLDTVPPPLVYDSKAHSLIDGTHRLAALELRGETRVWVYVGQN